MYFSSLLVASMPTLVVALPAPATVSPPPSTTAGSTAVPGSSPKAITLNNPSFEAGSLDMWSPMQSGAALALNTAYPHSGKTALGGTAKGSWYQVHVKQTLNGVAAGSNVNASFWLKTFPGSGNTTAIITLGGKLLAQKMIPPNSNWTQISTGTSGSPGTSVTAQQASVQAIQPNPTISNQMHDVSAIPDQIISIQMYTHKLITPSFAANDIATIGLLDIIQIAPRADTTSQDLMIIITSGGATAGQLAFVMDDVSVQVSAGSAPTSAKPTSPVPTPSGKTSGGPIYLSTSSSSSATPSAIKPSSVPSAPPSGIVTPNMPPSPTGRKTSSGPIILSEPKTSPSPTAPSSSSSFKVSSTPSASATIRALDLKPKEVIIADGTCGKAVQKSCRGYQNSFGLMECCSSDGKCGSGSAFCGSGCQSGFGKCYTSSINATTDGTCGGKKGMTCIGAKNRLGAAIECCSKSGYCGNTVDFCGNGCQAGFGKCSSKPTSKNGKCGYKNGSSTCSGYKSSSGVSMECCSSSGKCGNDATSCGTGCNNVFGACLTA